MKSILRAWFFAAAVCSTFAIATFAGPEAAAQEAAENSGAAPTVLVTGANRGLGLVWAQKYAERGWNVIATARDPDGADELKALAAETGTIRIEQLDALDEASIAGLVARLDGQPIDILVNNAGTLGDEAEQKLGALEADRFDHYMRTNALTALLVTQALLPNIRAGEMKKVTAISARAASFAAYPRMHSGLYYYKAGKAALNMIMRNLAMDLAADGITVIVLSPGVVNTYGTEWDMEGMSPEMQASMTDIDSSIEGMMAVVDDATLED